MKHLKRTWQLYRLDWRRLFKNPIALLLVIALAIIPSLYAWFNIAALWDPYGNTSDLKIAVYSDDHAATFQNKKLNIGDELIKKLHKNKQLGWTFVDSKKQLDKGVKSGRYYAGIYIPKNFSDNLISFTQGEINKPTIHYSVNEKINAIAPKITDKGATTLQEQITQEFLSTVSSTLVTQFNKLGINLETNLPTIRKLSSMVLTIDDHLDEIDGYTKEVLQLQQDLPGIKQKITKANSFMTYLPELNQLGDKVVKINCLMPEVDRAGKLVLDLQKKIPEIQNAGKQLNEIDQDFDGISETLNQGVTDAQNALTVIRNVRDLLPEITSFGQNAENTVVTSQDVVENIKKVLPQINQAVESALSTVISVSSTISDTTAKLEQFVEDHEITPEEKAELEQLLSDLADRISIADSLTTSLIDNLQKLADATQQDSLDGIIQDLQGFHNKLSQAETDIRTLAGALDQLSPEQIEAQLQAIIQTSKQITQAADRLEQANIPAKTTKLVQELSKTLDQAKDILVKANQTVIPKLDPLLASTSQTITNALGYLTKYQAQMPAVKQEIHDANVLVNNNMDLIVGEINQAADFYQKDFPNLKNKLQLATAFIQNDLPQLEKELTNTMKMVNQKLPLVEKAVNQASDLIKKDYPTLRNGVQKAAGFIRKQNNNPDLNDVIKLLKSDANAESDFFAQPVNVKHHSYYPIANYGSASAPFYTALCLWVGGLLLSSVATTDVFLSERQKKIYSKREQYSARMLTFLTIGFFQAIIVALGNLWLLNTYVVDKGWFVFYTIVIGFIFMSMLYILAAMFGNVGKGIGIIILVLSISGGGGNFPIQLSGKFFQLINPYLPFTYAVNLLRETAGGMYMPSVWRNLSVLLIFGVAFIAIGFIFQPFFAKQSKKLHEKTVQSHFFH